MEKVCRFGYIHFASAKRTQACQAFPARCSVVCLTKCGHIGVARLRCVEFTREMGNLFAKPRRRRHALAPGEYIRDVCDGDVVVLCAAGGMGGDPLKLTLSEAECSSSASTCSATFAAGGRGEGVRRHRHQRQEEEALPKYTVTRGSPDTLGDCVSTFVIERCGKWVLFLSPTANRYLIAASKTNTSTTTGGGGEGEGEGGEDAAAAVAAALSCSGAAANKRTKDGMWAWRCDEASSRIIFVSRTNPSVELTARAPQPLTRHAAARLAASFLEQEEAAKQSLEAQLAQLASEAERARVESSVELARWGLYKLNSCDPQ